jgi:hypothetical protein
MDNAVRTNDQISKIETIMDELDNIMYKSDELREVCKDTFEFFKGDLPSVQRKGSVESNGCFDVMMSRISAIKENLFESLDYVRDLRR